MLVTLREFVSKIWGFYVIYQGGSRLYLDIPKPILGRVSCKQTKQMEPLEIWKSKPVFRRKLKSSED